MAMVGRIIGKQGKKVLELQRESHAIIEVPMGAALGAAETGLSFLKPKGKLEK